MSTLSRLESGTAKFSLLEFQPRLFPAVSMYTDYQPRLYESPQINSVADFLFRCDAYFTCLCINGFSESR